MKTLAATALCMSVLASTAAADDFRADLKACEEQADLRMSGNRHSSATSSAIGGAANVLGAVLAGQNPAWALSGAAQGTIRGASSDAQAAEWKRQALMDQCLREKENNRRKAR